MNIKFKSPLKKYKEIIRDKAIKRVQIKIAEIGKSDNDFSEEELEILVYEEELKIKSEIKTKTGILAIVALPLGL
jgi:hypothetical protein